MLPGGWNLIYNISPFTAWAILRSVAGLNPSNGPQCTVIGYINIYISIFKRCSSTLSTLSGLLAFLGGCFSKIFWQIVSVRVKPFSNTTWYRYSILKGKRTHFRLSCERLFLSSLFVTREVQLFGHITLNENKHSSSRTSLRTFWGLHCP